METPYPAVEFEAEVTRSGTLSVPAAIAQTLLPGTAVIVRVIRGRVSAALRSRGVSEQEIEQIATRQLEPRENVLRFLQSEGILASSGRFRRRLAKRKS